MRDHYKSSGQRTYRNERHEEEGAEELMPNRRSRSSRPKEPKPRRPLDPSISGGDRRARKTDFYEELIEDTLASMLNPMSMMLSPMSMQTESSSVPPTSQASSTGDWESRVPHPKDEDRRDDHTTYPLPAYHRRRSSRLSGRTRNSGSSRSREGAAVRDDDVQTVGTEYDNVIVSRIQVRHMEEIDNAVISKPQKKHKEEPRHKTLSSKLGRNEKKKSSSKKVNSEEMSMASSIDDSSGVLELDFDNNLRSSSTNLLPYRRQQKPHLKPFQAIDEDDSGIVTHTHNAGSDRSPPSLSSHVPNQESKRRPKSIVQTAKISHYDASNELPRDSFKREKKPRRVKIMGKKEAESDHDRSQPSQHSRRSTSSPAFDDFQSILSGNTSVASASASAPHLPIQPLRWMEQDTDNLLMQLEFFGDNIRNDYVPFPKRSVEKIVSSIQAVIEMDNLRRDDPLLQYLNKALHSIRLVDLDKLLRLLKENHKVGNMLQDKRVLLLCGTTGSGKTTTLHYLAGSTLEEVDEQGFFHLKPVQCKEELKDFETSCCQKYVTKTMQATTVMVNMKRDENSDGVGNTFDEIVVCDTPGLGHADCVEEEITNGLGMINELQRAKSIHPVLLLSRESLGSRFGNLMEIINVMRDQFVLESKLDLAALNYLFTKYEGKHRTRICKQISVLEKVPPNIPDEDKVIYKSFVKDIIKKTTPRAMLALPMDEKSDRFTQEVWNVISDRDGKDLIVPFATKSATQKLKLQLQLTVHDFSNLLAKGDYPLALHRLHLLQEIAQILPDARDCAEKAREMGVRHVMLAADLIKEMIDEEDFVSAFYQTNALSKLKSEISEAHEPLERTTKRLRKRLKHVVEEGSVVDGLRKLESLRGLTSQLPQAKEFVQKGFDFLLKRLLRTMEGQDVDATMYQLEELMKVSNRIPEAGECASHALKALHDLVPSLSEMYDYDDLLVLIDRLCKIVAVFPDARKCIESGFNFLRKKVIRTFEEKRTRLFISQMRPLISISAKLPTQHKFANRGTFVLQDTVIEIIEGMDCSTAVDSLLSLQSVNESFPEKTDCIRSCFETLMLKAIDKVNEHSYRQGIDEIIKLGQLLPCLPTGLAPLKHGVKPLVKNVEATLAALSFDKSTIFVDRLHAASHAFPEIQCVVEIAIEKLLQHATILMNKKDHKEALKEFLHLEKMTRKMAISAQVIQRGISELQEAVRDTVTTLDFEPSLGFLLGLDKLSDIHPVIRKYVSDGFEALLQKAGKLMTVQDYVDALLQLEKLGEVKHKFTLTEDCVHRGLADFSITMNKFLQYMDFGKAIDVLQHLFRVSRSFPETMRCVQLGYELLLEKAVDIYEHRRFSQALDELKQLGQLFHQLKLPEECNRGNLKCLAAAVPRSMKDSEFGDALNIMKELVLLTRLIPEAIECVQVGHEVLLAKSVSELSASNTKDVFQQMKQLSQIVESVPELGTSCSQSLQSLEEKILLTLGEMDFAKGTDLLEDFSKLIHMYRGTEGLLLAGYQILERKTASAFEKNGFRQGIIQLHQLCQLRQLLKIEHREGGDIRGSDLINTRLLEALTQHDFDTGRELLESLNNLRQLYPQVNNIMHLGYRELQEKVAISFDKHGYHRAINQLQQLLQLGMLLKLDSRTISDSRGSSQINGKALEAINAMDFDATKGLLEDMYNLAQLHPEAKTLVVAGYKHLEKLTALTFEKSGCRQGVNELQQLAKLRQHLEIDKEGGLDGRGSDLINLKALDKLESLDFGVAVEFIEKVKKMLPLYPEGKEVIEIGFGVLLERTAAAFEERGYSQGISQLQQLGQLRQFLGEESLVSNNRGNEVLKQKVLETANGLKFETAVELTGRVNKIVHLYPEAEEIVLACFKQLLKRTAMTFENGYHEGIGRLQQLGRLKQLLEMDERDLDDSRGNDVLKVKVLEKMKRLDVETGAQLLDMIYEIVHIYPEAIEVVHAGFGELLDKVALVFEVSGYEEGIKQLQKLGQLKQQWEVDESAVKENRRRLLLQLVSAAQKNVEMLEFKTAVKFVQELNDVAKAYPEVKDGVEAAFESLVQRVLATFEENKCSQGADQLEELCELQQLLGLDERALRGLENIVLAAKKTFEVSSLPEITNVLCKLKKLVDSFADAQECMNAGLQIIWLRFEDAIQGGKYETASNMIQEIGAFSNVSPLADRYFRKGMKRLKKIADNTLDADDFMAGIDLSKILLTIDRGLTGDAGDTTQKGSDVIREQMERRIRQCDYSAAAKLIQKLLEGPRSTTQDTEYARAGLKLIEQQVESAITSREHSDMLSVLEHFASLESSLPEASNCLDYAAQAFKKVIDKNVEKKDFSKTLSMIEDLYKQNPDMRRVQDCVAHSMCVLGKAIEKPLTADSYEAMAELVHRLSQSPVPRAGDCGRRGLKGFWKTTKHAIEEHQYENAIILMRHMRQLAPYLPEAGDCVQLAFVALRVRLAKAIDKDKYEMAMALLQQLSSLAEELPEAFECAQFGFEALQDRIEKTIDDENYVKIMEQMRFLGRVTDHLPEVNDLFTIGFSALSEALSEKIDKSEFRQAVELMEQLTDLGKEDREEALDCTRQGLFKLWGKFEDRISEEDYSNAVVILQHLGAMTGILSEAEDGVQLGFEVLEEKFESMIDLKHYDAAVSLMKDLSKLAYELPEASSCIQNGFELLRERLVKIIEQQDYSTARNLIAMLEQEIPAIDRPQLEIPLSVEIRSVASGDDEVQSEGSHSQSQSQSVELTIAGDEKAEELRQKVTASLQENEYKACVDAMLQLSNMEHLVPGAGENLVYGLNLIKDHLEGSVERLNCTTVLEMMKVLEKNTHRLPVLGECSRFGLQHVQRFVARKLDEREYKPVIEIMDVLCKLSYHSATVADYLQHALDKSIQHMVVLRDEAATSFEELCETNSVTLFEEILDALCECLEAVMATDELRSFCTQIESYMSEQDKNQLNRISCGVRLAPEDSFCTEHIHKLTEVVGAAFPELLVEPESVEMLSGKEGNIVPTLERLLLMRRVLIIFPGAEAVERAVDKTLDKFYCFFDGLITLAQSYFVPDMNLKSFKDQILLVTSLIGELRKLNGLLQGPEMKKIEDLEHRRARLMLRFEIEVADSLEALDNQSFPEFTLDEREKMSAYLQTMKISQVQKHRDILLACVHSEELASLLSSNNVDVSPAERIVSSFDRRLEDFMDFVILQLEEEKEIIDALPKTKAGLPAPSTKLEVQVFCRDVPKVMLEMETISNWQTESYSMDAAYYMNRLKALDTTVKELTNKVHHVSGIGFASLFSSFTRSLNAAAGVSDYYSCVNSSTPDSC